MSVYLVASTGETFAAIRPGRKQDSNTVNSANNADRRKISGETLSVVEERLKDILFMTTGVKTAPTP